MTNEQIREELALKSDEKYRKFHTGLCPKSNEIIGVRVPILREIAKKIVNDGNVKEYLDNALDNSYEEIMIQGMVLGLLKTDIKTICNYLDKFIPKINSWAVCDTTAAGLKIIKKNMEYMWDYISKYLNSENEFEKRFVIVILLDYYLTDEYIDKVLQILNDVKDEKYYVKMAVAWTIQTSFVKYPDKTMKLLKKNNLDNWTYNKALQKILESYRVDEDKKILVKNMKKTC